MTTTYIKEKKSFRQQITDLFNGIISYWPITISVAAFIILAWLLNRKVSPELLLQIDNVVITAASILTAVLITFLAARVIQIRQEKIAAWSDYHKLTQQVHHFRGAIYPLYTSYDFWPNGMKYDMEHKYKELTYYDVRKVVFVHGTELSPLAKEFVDEGSGLKSLYLQLRSFFKGNVPHDISMFSGEFDSHLYYDTDELELWITFECGHGLYYYFNHKYSNFQESFHFNNISQHDQQSVKDHSMRIDPDRYRDVPFGNKLFDLLGQQFTAELLPKLWKLSRVVHGGLPRSVSFLAILLTILIPLGILIPLLVSLTLLSPGFSIISIAGIFSLLTYIMLAFHKTLSNEIKI